MNPNIKYLLSAALLVFSCYNLQGQTQEVKQLVLNVEKLNQLKGILKDMKQGYQVLSGGYRAVRDIAQGNFSLHDLFLEGLWKINPQIARYRRIGDIMALQKGIIREYTRAKQRFYTSGNFSPKEIAYMLSVYGQVSKHCLQYLEELLLVSTASKLRMQDAERLEYIDMLYEKMQDLSGFVHYFTAEAGLLNGLREMQSGEIQGLKRLHIQAPNQEGK